LQDYGFQAIVASSFADIFFSNCTKIGLLPVVLPEAEVQALMKAGEAEVDLEACEVRFDGRAVPFELDEDRRFRLLNGLDDIDLTLQKADEISAYEAERERPGPVTLNL
jgi:3-isopropylmalate/(R)-2-methylmalate dehydratase small subunit